MIRTLIKHAAKLLGEPRVIYDADGQSPYLSRWYLIGRPTMPDGSSPFTSAGHPKPGLTWSGLPFGLVLHRFHRSDAAQELHNHPWKWSLSWMLAGGYVEERRHESVCAPPSTCDLRRRWDVLKRVVRPGAFNLIHSNTFHRVDLLEDDAWTLFLTGPKASSWAFWNRTTGIYTEWRDFIRQQERQR